MDHPLFSLIEARIAEAEADGAFDNLPGQGAPLPHEPDPEGAILRRVMRNSGAAPAFVGLARELAELRNELAETGDRTRRGEILKEMSMMEARIAMARKDWAR